MLAVDDPRHGTNNAYSNLGCRCDRCRAASTEYHRSHGTAGYMMDTCSCGNPKRTIALHCRFCYDAARAPEHEHGREGKYNDGCRCDECREAARVGRARRRVAAA